MIWIHFCVLLQSVFATDKIDFITTDYKPIINSDTH